MIVCVDAVGIDADGLINTVPLLGILHEIRSNALIGRTIADSY